MFGFKSNKIDVEQIPVIPSGDFNIPKKEVLIEVEKEIKTPEIKALRRPMEQVLLQLGDKLEAGEYGVIIGDDASGRIASLALTDIVNHVYEDKGYKKPQHLFLAGQRGQDVDVKSREIGAHLEKVLHKDEINKGKKVLIVTDVIETGSSLIPLTKYLTEKGVEHDVVTMSFHLQGGGVSIYTIHKLETTFQANIYGPILFKNSQHHQIFGKHNLAGVQKDRGDLLSHRHEKYNAQEVKQVRKDLHILSEEIYSSYKKNIQETETNTVVKSIGILDEYIKAGLLAPRDPVVISEIFSKIKIRVKDLKEMRPTEKVITYTIINEYTVGSERGLISVIEKLKKDLILSEEKSSILEKELKNSREIIRFSLQGINELGLPETDASKLQIQMNKGMEKIEEIEEAIKIYQKY